MTAIDRTAYPRPGARLTREELSTRYLLADSELAFIRLNARGETGRLMLATLLKTRRTSAASRCPRKRIPTALLQTLLACSVIGWVRAGGETVSDFKGRHFEGEIVLWAVRWYCRFGVSYRDLEQMMGERGVSVDRSTIFTKQLELETA